MQFGDFETVRKVKQTGVCVIWEVRPVAGGQSQDKLAMKVLHDHWSGDERSRKFASFLARAKVQKGAGSANWAPVHAQGQTDADAYYVTDLYPSSVERLILNKAAAIGIDRDGLYRI